MAHINDLTNIFQTQDVIKIAMNGKSAQQTIKFSMEMERVLCKVQQTTQMFTRLVFKSDIRAIFTSINSYM